MERDIKNKIVVVTGGAQGIGFQIARSYLKAQAKLAILIDFNEEMGNKAVEEITAKFGANKAVYIKCNVAKDLEETFQKLCNEYGIIDILINNAGLGDEDVPENCVDVNLTATMKWSLKFMELMRNDVNGNGGTILNVASIFGYRITNIFPVYNATKYGVVGFTKALGQERNYNLKKVRVIAICPGFTRTRATQKIQDGNSDILVEFKNDYKWQSAEEVGEQAVEVFKIADSGTLWEIEGGVLREVK